MNLKEELFRCIYAYGFEKPSAIQQRAVLPAAIERPDDIAQGQSGTGNTATFSADILLKIDVKKNEVQPLVLASTRESAKQFHKEIHSYSQVDQKQSLVGL